MAFTCCLFRYSGMVFSKKNSVPVASIIRIHINFLMGLLVLTWIFSTVNPFLPQWTKERWIHGRSMHSDLDLLCMVVFGLMQYFEHYLIYKESADEQEAQP